MSKTSCKGKWVTLYIRRWLTAPFQMEDGTLVPKTASTPQGSVISPVLANLFLHYPFDKFIEKEFPNIPWTRYADDGVTHCATLKQAKYLLEKLCEAEQLQTRLKMRLVTCKLEIHPDKTRIVYCRSGKNKERHEHETFDFLGYTLRSRLTKTKSRKFDMSFSLAVSKTAVKGVKEKMRECRQRGKQMTPEQLAELMNPIIRGWANYFMKYGTREARNKASFYVNSLIVQWAGKRYKKLSGGRGKAYKWLCAVAKTRPCLFYHWQLGMSPTMTR